MANEHFSVDGTLIQAWASHKSFQPKTGPGDEPPASGGSDEAGRGRNGERDWRGQKRSNETHRSTTDGDARLARKSNGQASILAYAGHVLMENANGLVARSCLTHATGTAEREAGLQPVDRLKRRRRITLGADKGYDAASFIAALRERKITPHVAVDRRVSKTGTPRRSAVDGRTTRHRGYQASQRVLKRIEEVFGWIKAAAAPTNQASRTAARRMGLRPGNHSIQPDQTAKAAPPSYRLTAIEAPARSPAPPTLPTKATEQPDLRTSSAAC